MPRTKPQKLWTYAEAQKTVPYVRRCLGDLRERYVRMMHLWRRKKEATTTIEWLELDRDVRCLSGDCQEVLAELLALSICVFGAPWRGIAIFPMRFQDDGLLKNGYFIYKDSRDSIETFISECDLKTVDLTAHERPVLQEWKRPAFGM